MTRWTRLVVALSVAILATAGVPAAGALADAAGSWQAVAPLPTPRQDMAAVVGPDGRLYATGGVAAGGAGDTYVAAVEAYTPATDTWSAVAPLPNGRAGAAATVGPDGRIDVIGGASGGGLAALASVVAYDPASGVWRSAGGLPEARSGASAVTIDGRVYVVGGVPNIALTVLNSVIGYSSAAGDWISAGTIPSPFAQGFGPTHAGSPAVELGPAVAPPGGPIYALASRHDPISGAYSDTLVAYDPTTRRSLDGPALPVGLIDAAVVMNDN